MAVFGSAKRAYLTPKLHNQQLHLTIMTSSTSPTKLNLGQASRVSTLQGYEPGRKSVSPIRALRSPLKTLTPSEHLRPAALLAQPVLGTRIGLNSQSTLASPVRRSGSTERRQRILELEQEGVAEKKQKTVSVKSEPEIITFTSEPELPALVVDTLNETNSLLRSMRDTQRLLLAEVRELRATVNELKKQK